MLFPEWSSHLQDPVEKERFENQVKAAKPVLERLNNIMGQRLQAIMTSERRESDFDTPNWDYRQAFRNGFVGCLSIYCKYLEIDPKERV